MLKYRIEKAENVIRSKKNIPKRKIIEYDELLVSRKEILDYILFKAKKITFSKQKSPTGIVIFGPRKRSFFRKGFLKRFFL